MIKCDSSVTGNSLALQLNKKKYFEGNHHVTDSGWWVETDPLIILLLVQQKYFIVRFLTDSRGTITHHVPNSAWYQFHFAFVNRSLTEENIHTINCPLSKINLACSCFLFCLTVRSIENRTNSVYIPRIWSKSNFLQKVLLPLSV